MRPVHAIKILTLLLCTYVTAPALASERAATWTSDATGAPLAYEIFAPVKKSSDATRAGSPVVILLKNLPSHKTRGEEEKVVAELTGAGYVVMRLDYARHPKAITPDLNRDVLKLRREAPALLASHNIDKDESHLFVLPADYRLAEDVEFYQQDGRSYRMDVRYPANARSPVPLILQISHDNIDRRRNRAFVRYDDTLLDGLAMRGYAVATMEHMGVGTLHGKTPVMPDHVHKLKAAVRTLRANARAFNFDANRIGVIGFSKGGTGAAMLATMGSIPELEGDGLHREQSSRVQAAVCLAGRFDFRDFEESYTEREEWKRFLSAHGHPAENPKRYAELSAITYISPDDAPMFFFVGEADSTRPINTRRMVLALRRARHKPEHAEEEKLDHRITTDRQTIETMYLFLDRHLKPLR